MRFHSTVVTGLVLLALIACHKGGKSVSVDLPRPAPSLTVTMRELGDDAFLLADNSSVFGNDTLRTVIRDSIEWKRVWDRAVSLKSTKPTRPVIDFNKEMVVLAAAGRMKPGDLIHIDSAGTRGNLTVIVVRTTKGCQTIATSAFPFEIARIPKNNGDDTFREHNLTAPDCQ